MPPDEGRVDGDGVDVAAAEHNRQRLRAPVLIVGLGLLLGVSTAVVTGQATSDGRAALAVLLLVSSLTTAVAGLHVGLLLLLDDVRGRPTSLRRGLVAGALFVLTAAQMGSFVGIGG